MNKIIKEGEIYTMICEDGTEFQGKMHLEKGKTWYIHFAKNNPSGREFFNQTKVDAEIAENGEYAFDTKTEHRTVGSWKSKLTEEEKEELQQLEERIEAIKTAAMSRQTPKVDKNSAEYVAAQIAKLQEKLAKLKA